MERVVLDIQEHDFAGCASDEERASRLHSFIAAELGFPGHYGMNLDALNDCLGDVCEPVRAVVSFAGKDGYDRCLAWMRCETQIASDSAWLARFVRVFLRAAQENPFIELVLTHETP